MYKKILRKIIKSSRGNNVYNQSIDIWYSNAISRQHEYMKRGWGEYYGNYYEFGVGGGRTLLAYLRAMNRFSNKHIKDNGEFNVFLFDSFKGLPKSLMKEDDHKDWSEGAFSYSVDYIKDLVNKLEFKKPNIKYISGYYEDTLNEEQFNMLSAKPPSIVTIDVDYYSSTKTVLDFLDKFINTGTLFYFDDIWAFSGNPNYGELKAIDEFNKDDTKGYLTPYPLLGLPSQAYVYARKQFEYKS